MTEGVSSGGLPGASQPIPGFPSNAIPIEFSVFAGLNTKASRPGIEDQEMSWCDGWMPIGPRNLRTLYGVGSPIYTADDGQIVYFTFGNIAEVPYAYVLLSDGSIQQVAVQGGAITEVAPAGTILEPTSIIGFSQWGSKYIIIVADQDNGYWLWDGSNLFTAGTLGPTVVLASSGKNYTSVPTVTLTTTGSGTGATFSPVLDNDTVVRIDVTDPGTGFAINDYTVLTVTGGGSDDQAKAAVTINANSGPLSGAFVTNGGTHYDATTYVTLSGGGGSGGQIGVTVEGGTVKALTVITPGTGYTSEPSVTIHGGDSNAVGFVTISRGSIASASVVSAGSGYTEPPTLLVVGDGHGAQLQAHIDSTGVVTSIAVISPGSGYTKALVQFNGGNDAAEGSVSLMPFGISGTTVETFQNRVWIGSFSHNIPKGIFSAPNDPANFGAPDGGGAFPSNDSFLRVNYHRFIQTNGFLYLIADSSMNYISGVQTTGSPATTTFGNLNVDPQIGTPWPNSVQVFSRNIVFANSFGVHVSYGGAVTKISQPLDGIYNTVLTQQQGGTFTGFYPSSAVASIFGIQCYMLLLPIIDPYTGQQVNKLLMWDGRKWWTSPQDVTLTYIATQEINSILQAWGTDGTSIYPLFNQPTEGFSKVVQSKLWANPSYLFVKESTHVLGLANFYEFSGTLDVLVDNETQAETVIPDVAGNGAQWVTAGGDPVAWTTAGGDPVTWMVPGIVLLGPVTALQNGVLMGLTITTDAKDVALLSMTLVEMNYSSRL